MLRALCTAGGGNGLAADGIPPMVGANAFHKN